MVHTVPGGVCEGEGGWRCTMLLMVECEVNYHIIMYIMTTTYVNIYKIIPVNGNSKY